MLKFAFDRHRRLIPSDKAEHGMDYYCPCCGVIVRLKISKNGVPFYFCLRGKHTETDCAEFAERLSDYATDDINVRTIMLNMIRVPGPQGPHGPGHGGGPRGHAEGLTTMRLLWMAGIPYAEPDMPIHGGVLADYLIGPKAFARYLSNDGDIGKRIIMAMPEKVLSGNRIRFRCPWLVSVAGKVVIDNKRLTLRFADADTFYVFRNSLFSENSSNELVPQYQYVLIAGNWNSVSHDDCKSICYKCKYGEYKCKYSERCQGMLVADCHTAEQIYVPDTQRNRLRIN
jgi:hypothetical protein